GPTHLRINQRTGIVYVLNTESDSVTIVDGRRLTVLGTVPVRSYPIGIAVDERNGKAYIASNRGNSLAVLDETARQVVGTRRIPRNVSSVALNVAEGLLYLTLKSDDRVVAIRLRDLEGRQ